MVRLLTISGIFEMAVGRLPAIAPQPASQPPAGPRAAAQAAFFQAALGKVEAPQPAASAAAPPSETVQSLRETRVEQPADPDRGYRPGSLLDIRI